MTKIDLGACEILIRNYYNLSNNETLYMKIIEIKQEGMKIPKIEYEVYSKFFENNLEKLNKTICENTRVSFIIPIILTGNIDKVNCSSGYYNNICYTAKSDSGTDISLKDRRKEFDKENITVCQEDCVFSDYNYTTFKANCSCKVKKSSSSFIDMNINKTKLFENFENIKNFMNLNILVCHRSLFNKNGIIKNVGFFILLTIILLHFVNIFIFYIKQIDIIEEKIKDINFAINNDENNRQNKDKENDRNNKILPRKARNKGININNNILIKGKSKEKEIKIDKKKRRKKQRLKNKEITERNYVSDFIDNKKNNNSNIALKINNNADNHESKSKMNEHKKNEKAKKIMEYNDYEINNLKYDIAVEKDKRSYCFYYISLLREKQSLIFSFYNNNDYNSKILKIDLFFIGFSIYYTVNALFFNDETMHKIYESKGSFDLEYQLPITIYSSLISTVINIFLKLLTLSNNCIIDFKQNKNKDDVNQRATSLIFKIKMKSILYFFISFVFLLFFWYYISMFGAIYKNTQYHLLKDTIISFGISMLIPFGTCLLPGFFRIPSLSYEKKNRECLYNFSKILQIL